MNSSERDIMRQCAGYCSTAERCVSEVRKRLAGLDVDDEAADRIIAALVNEKFIDEARYSRAFVNDKFRFNKWGRRKIAFELKQKGLSSLLIEDALDTIDAGQYDETLKNLLLKKKASVKAKSEYDLVAKLASYAVSKGFEAVLVFAAIKQLTGLDDESLD